MLDDCVIWTVHNLRRKSQNNALIFKTMTIDIQVISLLIDLVVLFLLLMNFEALTFSGTNPFDIRIIGYYFHLSLYFRMRWDHIRRFTLRSNKDFPGFKEFFMGGVRTKYLKSVFPSESFPAWQSINTGTKKRSNRIEKSWSHFLSHRCLRRPRFKSESSGFLLSFLSHMECLK